jgi:hypothetical protein
MVDKDTNEMSMKNFGSCFVTSSADIIESGFGLTNPTTNVAKNFQPTTFTKGWSRGGVVSFSDPSVKSELQLVMVVITHGHYEVTLSAIVGSFTKAKSLLSSLTNTLLSRMENSSSKAV